MSYGNPDRSISVSPTTTPSRRGGRDCARRGHGGDEPEKIANTGQDDIEVSSCDAVHPVDEVKPDNVESFQAEVEEEAEVIKPLPTPETPTRSDVLSHRVTHDPYRPWCEDCVEGRGREFGHSSCDRGNHGTPIVSFDYCYIGDKGEVLTQEEFEADEGAIKVLVVKKSRKKGIFSHVVPRRGIDEKRYAVDVLVDDVKWLGYTKICLKSDNEKAILKLLTETLRELRIEGLEEVQSEHPPEYDPQSNGQAEAAVRQIKGQIRTLRSSLERDIGFRIPAKHPLVAWLVRHAGDILNWSVKGIDGMTPYHRIRSRHSYDQIDVLWGDLPVQEQISGTFVGACGRSTLAQRGVHRD